MNKEATERDLDVRIESAGLAAFSDAERASDNAIEAVSRLGADLTYHRSKPVTHDLIEQCDLILTMTEAQKTALTPYAEGKVFTLMEYAGLDGDITDPYSGDMEIYMACANQIYDAVKRICDKIENND